VSDTVANSDGFRRAGLRHSVAILAQILTIGNKEEGWTGGLEEEKKSGEEEK